MKAISIHIGLNKVNPAHYGSDAPLKGCHNDAHAMEALAQAQGYKPAALLLDENATVKALGSHLKAAAKELAAGDSLLLTYSGHGSQIDDTNSDEDDGEDETWCLFDRMMLDDELYKLYSGFKKGVRITVLSDSCHSGTVTRAFPPVNTAELKGTRLLPKNAREHVRLSFLDQYTKLQEKFGQKPVWSVKATVILLSGCMDEEVSFDGAGYGNFTATLLNVWNKGAFKGSLKQLHKAILAEIKNQTPNYSVVGSLNTAFENAHALKP